MDPVDSIELVREETDDSIEVSDEDDYNLTDVSDDGADSSINVSDKDNDFSVVVSYIDADISSNDDSSYENSIPDDELKIRKEFEEADNLIPQIATATYSGSHPEAVWTSRLLYFPDLADKLSKLTL
ncbi:3567_t:CDS:2 [Racocetra fulgida]|uniref:3567_t:CDS:1 n=1 Tax=Racocetra fulgida TaxID=60492 RepID=A0A9N9DDT3_9GLOM|nr:3567_t:CDS:2 [Racocetra fulgida]